MKKESSYTAAAGVPLKILLDTELVRSIEEGKILPRHIQFNPTNKCTRKCSWCSCSNRNRALEMPYAKVVDVMHRFKKLGAHAVTITGGGEPLCHPEINEMIHKIASYGFAVGMVTNADLIDELTEIDKLTWIRISLGDGLKFSDAYWKALSVAVEKSRAGWSFSYVVDSNSPDYELIEAMVRFANRHSFLHIRMVNNIFNADELRQAMGNVKQRLAKKGIDDNLIIYQDRGVWTPGTKRCLIPLLKPVVTADGKLAACCGEQYMTEPPRRDYIADWGSESEIEEIWREQRYYDGSKCKKCYYDNYNQILATLLGGIDHKKFV